MGGSRVTVEDGYDGTLVSLQALSPGLCTRPRRPFKQ